MTISGLGVLVRNKNYKAKKIGILTNQSGIDSDGIPNIDILIKNGFNIKRIFVPEHGLYGKNGGGERISNHIDQKYHLPIFSLYNESLMIDDPFIFDGIDLFLYDIQDVGARSYTYIATLRAVLTAFDKYRINLPIVILDRPAFLGNKIQGTFPDTLNFLAPEFIPIRYGWTVGEYANFIKDINKLKINLKIVKMECYKNGMNFLDTKLPYVKPSSAIKDFDTAFFYTGSCLLEGTELSEGRGTERPFLIFGATDLPEIKYSFSGVKWEFTDFRPKFNKLKEKICRGIKILSIDYENAHPFRDIVLFLMKLYKAHPFKFLLPHFDNLAGGSFLRNMIVNDRKEKFLKRLESDEYKFKKIARKYYLYKKFDKKCFFYYNGKK